MIENPAERAAKQTKAQILQAKHEATLQRKLTSKENAHTRYANAQVSLAKAGERLIVNPTKKNYRFWKVAITRALPILMAVVLFGCNRNIDCPIIGTKLNTQNFNHCTPISGSSSHQTRYACYPGWSGPYFLITVDAEGNITEWEWK